MTRNYKEEYQRWLDSPALSEAEWEELNSIANDEKEIESRFFAPLEFGTAGLRGTMKLGLHQMNVHIIRHATQAFANVIKAEGEEAMKKGIAICFDCRNNSELFAHEAACVMAANGIHVRIFDALRPTPELSFAVRCYGTTAGLNITASHNPKEYNGYKVYWSDGAQLPPQHAEAIAEQMSKIDIFDDFVSCDFDEAVAQDKIELIGTETDEAYLERVLGQAINKAIVAKVAPDFKIVYTPFHGAGYKLVPEALHRLGITQLYPVPEQMVIDGNFPTVESPNPENPEGFYLAVDLAKKVGSDLIIGTDPDSDRIGVIYKGKIVEIASSEELFDYPLHPYTRSLISAIPLPDPQLEKHKVLYTYDPSMHNYTDETQPELVDIGHGHFVYGSPEEIAEYRALRERGEPLKSLSIVGVNAEAPEEGSEVNLAASEVILDRPVHDTGSAWYAIISFFLPILGLIAAFVFRRHNYIRNYKACRKGVIAFAATLGVCVALLLLFIVIAIL